MNHVMARRVVVDTNILVQSPRLNSGSWRALRRAGERGEIELYFPKICIIEAEAWFERERMSRVAAFDKARSRLAQLGARIWPDSQSSPEVPSDQAEYLTERLARAGTILPIPAITHEQLVRRASQHRHPFNEHGSGYRDALIWESVCDLTAGGPLVFLTQNSHDFGVAPDLFEDLQADLVERGVPAENVTLESILVRVIEALVPADDVVRGETERTLNNSNALDRLGEGMGESLLFGEGLPYVPSRGELPEWFGEPVAEMIWDPSNVRVAQAHPVDEDSYLVSGSLQADGRIYSILNRAEWASVPDRERNLLSGVDEDYREDVAAVIHRPVIVQFEAVFTPPSDIADVDVLSIEPDTAGRGSSDRSR